MRLHAQDSSNTVLDKRTEPMDNFHVKTDITETLKFNEGVLKEEKKKWFFIRNDLKWIQILSHIIYHIIGIYGFLTFPYVERFKTIIWAFFVLYYGMFGVTAGIHRLWSHKCYKAKLPFKIILAFGYLTALQFKFRKWIEFHRVHHKYMDTDADPHNSKRGFFYSHLGWLMLKRPREVTDKFKKIDMSDIDADPFITFCDKHYFILTLMVQFIAILIPVNFWNEDWYYSLLAQFMRFLLTVHFTASVNSFAHLWGTKPYDKNIAPTDNLGVAFATFGEGWHNYHHVFPYDYRTPDIAGSRFDLTAKWIKFFEKIGWTYDLKQPSDSLIKLTMKSRGDGTLLKSIS